MRHLILLSALTLCLALPATASASAFKFVVENGGDSYALSSGNYLSLLGIYKSKVDFVDMATLAGTVRSGELAGIYAGPAFDPATPDWGEPFSGQTTAQWTPLSMDDVLHFDESGAARNSLWLEYASRNLVLKSRGTATMNSKGGLGNLDAIPEPSPVPVPGALWLMGTGLVGLVGFRARRGRQS